MSKEELKGPSQEFKDAIIHASSVLIGCTFCGRVYFTGVEPSAFEKEGELEELIEQSKKEPDKYIQCGDRIMWGNLAGYQCVVDCKCHGSRVYEDVFWENRHIIRDYLVAMAKKQQRYANSDSKLVENISNAVNSLGE